MKRRYRLKREPEPLIEEAFRILADYKPTGKTVKTGIKKNIHPFTEGEVPRK